MDQKENQSSASEYSEENTNDLRENSSNADDLSDLNEEIYDELGLDASEIENESDEDVSQNKHLHNDNEPTKEKTSTEQPKSFETVLRHLRVGFFNKFVKTFLK
jgi:hypothetical protein